MHELGMCEALLAAVERRAAGRQVTAATVRVGTTHRLDADAFRFSFELLAEGTVAEGATLDVVVIPAEATCRDCGTTSEPADHLPLCPSCGSADLQAHTGDELVLESISVRNPVGSGGS